MRNGFCLALASLVLLCALPGPVLALHPERNSVRGISRLQTYLANHLQNEIARDGKWHRIQELPLTLSLPGEGVFTVRLEQARLKNWQALIVGSQGAAPDTKDVALFKGSFKEKARAAARARVTPGRYPVAGSVYRKDGTDYLQLSFESRGIRGKPARKLMRVALHMGKDGASVNRPPSSGMLNKICGTALHAPTADRATAAEHETAAAVTGSATAAAAARIATIATEADYAWYSIYGSNSNAEIASMLNTVETIYGEQLELGLELTRQHVFTSSDPFTSTDAETMLGQFQQYTVRNRQLPQSDIYFMLSGKNFNDNVVGIAYVGAVCVDPEYSFGAAQRVNSATTPIIIAHEVGHIFNANHDDVTRPTTIMASVLPYPPPNSFSSTSRGQISSFINRYGPLCLSDVNAPTPTVTATATPTVPGVPSTSTPTPTPTATSGGPGGGPANPVTPAPTAPAAALNAAVDKRGAVRITVTVAQTDPACTVEILASNSRYVSLDGRTLISFVADEPSATYEALIPRKTLTSGAKPPKVYFAAKVSCGIGVTPSYSKVKSVSPSRVVSRKKPLSVGGWIKLLRRALISGSRTH